MKLFNRIAVLAVLFAGFTTLALAAQVSANSTVAVTYTKSESITVNVAGSVTIAADGSSNSATVTGTYNLVPASHTHGIRIALYPAGGLTAALTGPANVPASAISASLNGQWTLGPCTNPDPDNVNAGIADECYPEGAAVGTSTSQLVSQTALNTTPSGSLPSSTLGFGFFPSGTFPALAGTYTGNFTVLVYAL